MKYRLIYSLHSIVLFNFWALEVEISSYQNHNQNWVGKEEGKEYLSFWIGMLSWLCVWYFCICVYCVFALYLSFICLSSLIRVSSKRRNSKRKEQEPMMIIRKFACKRWSFVNMILELNGHLGDPLEVYLGLFLVFLGCISVFLPSIGQYMIFIYVPWVI